MSPQHISHQDPLTQLSAKTTILPFPMNMVILWVYLIFRQSQLADSVCFGYIYIHLVLLNQYSKQTINEYAYQLIGHCLYIYIFLLVPQKIKHIQYRFPSHGGFSIGKIKQITAASATGADHGGDSGTVDCSYLDPQTTNIRVLYIYSIYIIVYT